MLPQKLCVVSNTICTWQFSQYFSITVARFYSAYIVSPVFPQLIALRHCFPINKIVKFFFLLWVSNRMVSQCYVFSAIIIKQTGVDLGSAKRFKNSFIHILRSFLFQKQKHRWPSMSLITITQLQCVYCSGGIITAQSPFSVQVNKLLFFSFEQNNSY